MRNSVLNLISFNTFGADDNVLYIEQLCLSNDVVFLSETWLKSEQKYILSGISEDHNVFFRSDMTISPRFGRPYGGRAWYIRKTIEVIHCDFTNEHLSVIVFKKDNIYFTVMGVYLPYDNRQYYSLNEYTSLLCLIQEISQYSVDKGHIVLIAGDFNADVNRGNRFDNLLQKFVSENKYLLLDQQNRSSDDFTYSKGNYKAFIDHCILSNEDKILNWQCCVLYDDTNTSDHNAVRASITFEGTDSPQL